MAEQTCTRANRSGDVVRNIPDRSGQKEAIPYFDMVLDSKNLKEDAMKLFAEIRPAWKIDDLDTETYSEGYLNCLMCFRLRSDETYEDAIVLRLYGGLREDMKVFYSDRELCVMQIAQHAGCFQPILAVFPNGVAYKRAPGRTLTMADFLDPKIIRSITRKLVAFHHFDATSVPLINHKGEPCKLGDDGEMDYAAKRLRYLNMVPESLKDPEEDARYQKVRVPKDELFAEYKEMIDTTNDMDMNMTLCHGDFHMKNMVYDEETGNVIFLDYEMTERRQEASDLVKLFGFRPVLELVGMIKPEDPELTPEARLEWIRCYLEAKYTHFGKDPADIPEVLVEFNDVEHAILEAYQTQTFVLMGHVFCAMKLKVEVDYIEKLPEFNAIWNEKKEQLPALVERYKRLKEECVKLGHL